MLSLLYQRQQFCNSLFCELSDSSIYVHSATHILVNSSNCMMPVLFPSCLYVENYTKFSVGPVCVAVAAFLVQINFKYMEAVLMKTCFFTIKSKEGK